MTTDITPEAVEQLARLEENGGTCDTQFICYATTLRALSAALTASQAETAAAYEVAALVLDSKALDLEADASRFKRGTDRYHYRMNFSIAARRHSKSIRALTPADSKAALDRMIAEARADGMREAVGIANQHMDHRDNEHAQGWEKCAKSIHSDILAAIPNGTPHE